MTPEERIAEIEERLSRLPRTPWRERKGVFTPADGGGTILRVPHVGNGGVMEFIDARCFIAHAPTDLRYLLERVEELEGALHREDRSDDGSGLIPAVEWMLDIIEMYEERLIQFGDPPEKVRSDINEYAKAKARRDLDRARQALDTGDDDADRR